MSAYQQLEEHVTDIYHLQHLQAIGGWDEAVMMPTGSGRARAKALSTLQAHIHQLISAPAIGDLINQAKEQPELNTWQTRNLYWIEKHYINATLLPTELVKAQSEARITCEQQWRICRAANDWATFLPYLEQNFSLLKECTELRAEYWQLSCYDMLLDDYSPGFNQASIDPIFDTLESQLPELTHLIIERQKQHPITPLQGTFDIEKQRQLSLEVMKTLGFDFNKGRLDVTHHPFCGGVAEDVRITTRYDEHDFTSSLMAVCHETGHALYEQGLPKDWISQPVGHALGMAVHESQSLFVEMQLCRSKAFIKYLLPLIKRHFKDQPGLTANNLFSLATRVKPSLIRVDADEATYPLHVILRYNIEKQLLNGSLSVADLPECWDQHMQQYLGLSTLGNDRNGVMQDVHWPSGAFGYFPSYTLGRIIAAQLFDAMRAALPNLNHQLEAGKFDAVNAWLRDNIHSQASSLNSSELIEQATGEALNPNYFLDHLKSRYLD